MRGTSVCGEGEGVSGEGEGESGGRRRRVGAGN